MNVAEGGEPRRDLRKRRREQTLTGRMSHHDEGGKLASRFYICLNVNNHFLQSIFRKVCDADKKILDIVAGWPGSCHDSHIWCFCELRQLLHEMQFNKFLLGDSGYPLENCLMTPYICPVAPQECLNNRKHRTTRNVIEHCLEVVKSRFRIIDLSGGIILYTPEKSCKIIITAAILHNMCKKYKVKLPLDAQNLQSDDDDEDDEEDDEEDDDDDNDDDPFSSYQSESAHIIRDELALRFQAAT